MWFSSIWSQIHESSPTNVIFIVSIWHNRSTVCLCRDRLSSQVSKTQTLSFQGELLLLALLGHHEYSHRRRYQQEDRRQSSTGRSLECCMTLLGVRNCPHLVSGWKKQRLQELEWLLGLRISSLSGTRGAFYGSLYVVVDAFPCTVKRDSFIPGVLFFSHEIFDARNALCFNSSE